MSDSKPIDGISHDERITCMICGAPAIVHLEPHAELCAACAAKLAVALAKHPEVVKAISRMGLALLVLGNTSECDEVGALEAYLDVLRATKPDQVSLVRKLKVWATDRMVEADESP